MEAKLNHKSNLPWAVESITMHISVVESLLLQRALTNLAKDKYAHPDAREMAREFLADWQNFRDNIVKNGETK